MHFAADDSTLCHGECNESDIVSVDTLPKHEQRILVFYLLYALDAYDYDVSLEAVAYNLGNGFHIALSSESAVFKQAQDIVEKKNELDAALNPLLANWRPERLSMCTRLISRLSMWELLYTEIPSTVVINEAIELAKSFAETDAYKFINGVLDEWVKRNKPAQ